MRLVFPRQSIRAVPLALLAAWSCPAAAQEVADETVASGKGVAGGVLLGAEAVMLSEAALRVKPAWAYIVGGVAGAVGGGVGGYFLEQEADAKLSLYVLAGGMALAIPTTVAVLSARAYRPPRDYTQDRAPSDEPPAEPAAPDVGIPSGSEEEEPSAVAPGGARALGRLEPRASEAAPLALSRLVRPPALLGLDRGALVVSVPAVEVRDVYTRREIALYGLDQGTEVRLPVFSALF